MRGRAKMRTVPGRLVPSKGAVLLGDKLFSEISYMISYNDFFKLKFSIFVQK